LLPLFRRLAFLVLVKSIHHGANVHVSPTERRGTVLSILEKIASWSHQNAEFVPPR
jgi:hypothetical protein